ncbi:hypothetical protein RV12_GL001133 [Enterococcus quebecensis]|nr:hypothetical protein RV12_GL001133 [Enterococcus quebecensis]
MFVPEEIFFFLNCVTGDLTFTNFKNVHGAQKTFNIGLFYFLISVTEKSTL